MIGNRNFIGDFQKIPAFRNLNESECHQLVEISQEKMFAPGEKIIEQGKNSQSLWIVLEGQCEVTKDHSNDGQPVVLAKLDAFSLFGEMSFFSPAPHSATVVARTPVKLLRIAREDYDDLIRDGAIAAYKLAYNVVEHVADRLRHMDEWVAHLTARPESHTAGDEHEKLPEWKQFRNKLFNGWNL